MADGNGPTPDDAGLPARPRRRDAKAQAARRRRSRSTSSPSSGVPATGASTPSERETLPTDVPVTDEVGDELPASRRRRTRRRAAVSRRRRRRGRLRTAVGVLVLLVVAAAAIAVASLGMDGARGPVLPSPAAVGPPAPTIAPDDRQPALVLVVTDGTEGSDTAAVSIAVVAYDRDADQGTVLLVPGGTVADVPGHGSFTVGDAYAFGQGPLVAVTLDNLLDVRLDGVMTVDPDGWEAIADALGPVPVEVRSPLAGRTATGEEVRFASGPQQLEGPQLAGYATLEVDGETELERLPRLQQVLAGLLERVAADPATFAALVGYDPEGVTGDPAADAGDPDAADAPVRTSDPALTYALFTELADARHREQVTALTLPVSPLGTGRDDLYRLDAGRAGQLVDERLAASQPLQEAGAGRSLQVLNGNGVPGIGQEVAERLQPGGYRILLTGNADRFTHEVTRIVIYDETPAQLAVARDIQERLGTGEIERSGTPQSVVDVTIVVGRDFPPDG
jgi:polyisoprenyl-teichoic acid--peptidoglycan teichoic acid transferase